MSIYGSEALPSAGASPSAVVATLDIAASGIRSSDRHGAMTSLSPTAAKCASAVPARPNVLCSTDALPVNQTPVSEASAPGRPASRADSVTVARNGDVLRSSFAPWPNCAPLADVAAAVPKGQCYASVPWTVVPSPLLQDPQTQQDDMQSFAVRISAPVQCGADSGPLHETTDTVRSENDCTLLAAKATHASRVSEEIWSSVPRRDGASTPTRRSPLDQCSTVSGSSDPAHCYRGLKIGESDSEPCTRRQDLRAGKTGDGDPTWNEYVTDCKNSGSTVLDDGRFSAPARSRGGDEILKCSEILNSFDLSDSRIGRGDFWDDRRQKRNCQNVQAGGQRDASPEDHERCDTGSSRNYVKDSRVRSDLYHDERRRHSKYDRYEGRRTHRTELSTDDHGKSGCCKNRRYRWREQERYDEWKKQRSGSSGERSDKTDGRYENQHSDYSPYRSSLESFERQGTYRSSLESSFERQSDVPHRYKWSDFPPDLRRGCGVAGRRKHRDHGQLRGTHCDQKSNGTNGGRHTYPQYEYALRSGYDYAYYAELYRTNPTYRQQVDAYYARLGYSASHLMQAISVHAELSCNYPRLDDSSSSSANYYCDPKILDHVPRLEEVKKFPRPHPLARFCGVGGLVKLVPTVSDRNVPQPIEIHSLRNLFRSDPQFRELQAFPGPLVKSDTHKDNVIHFCKDKIRSFAKDPTLPDRSSRILLWELLLLMVRQNGFVSGSDIAELLVRECEPSGSAGAAPVLGTLEKEDTASTGEITEKGDSTSPDELIVLSDTVQLESPGSNRAVSKFREFLFFGRTKRALDWAAKHGLWGHALCLASKMNAQTYAATLTRFTNSLAANDPLRTLYQHLSGRQPTSVTCAAAERWGNWRPHLAMILSNPSTRPEVNARSIVTLGDSLASRGCLSAAHFCYLAAHVEFGSYARKSSKLVLLGSCHQTLSFREFASNDAIQATEIYEYAQSLADSDYTLPHLQPYKFLLAMRLAEYGFAQEALHYCEVLAEAMTRHCWSGQLASETYDLASRLKYHSPHFIQEQGELEELGDPPWLATLARICNEQLLRKPASGTSVTQPLDGFTHDNDYVSDRAQFTASMPSTDSVQGRTNLTPESSAFGADECNLQQPANDFSSHEGARAFWSNWQAATTSAEQTSPMLHATNDNGEQQLVIPSSLAAPPFVDHTKDSDPGGHWNSLPRVNHDTILYHPKSMQASVASLAPAVDAGDMEPQRSIAVQPVNVYDYESTEPPLVSIESHAATMSEPLYIDTSAYQPPHVDALPYQPLHVDASAPSTALASTEVGGYDYYKTCTYSDSRYQQHCGTSREHLSDVRNGKEVSDQRGTAPHSRQLSPQSPAKDQGQAARKKRWFVDGIMGAFERLVPKGPNQMILPDDTDPGIVWDEQKKRWIDKHASAEEVDSRMVAPPPDSSFVDHPHNKHQNRFQLNKQRRRRYVDVQNVGSDERSGNSTASSSLAPFLLQPAATQALPQFFVPCVSEQHGTGCEFVSPPPPPSVHTVPSVPPPSATPAPSQSGVLTFDMA